MTDWIGYRWLARTCKVDAVQRFRVESALASSRSTRTTDGYRTDIDRIIRSVIANDWMVSGKLAAEFPALAEAAVAGAAAAAVREAFAPTAARRVDDADQ